MLVKDHSAHSAAHVDHGINFPRLYDLIVKLLARGRESTYRKDVLDLAGIMPGDHVLDIAAVRAPKRSRRGDGRNQADR